MSLYQVNYLKSRCCNCKFHKNDDSFYGRCGHICFTDKKYYPFMSGYPIGSSINNWVEKMGCGRYKPKPASQPGRSNR